MPQQFLNGTDVVAALQEMRSEGMPKRVAGCPSDPRHIRLLRAAGQMQRSSLHPHAVKEFGA